MGRWPCSRFYKIVHYVLDWIGLRMTYSALLYHVFNLGSLKIYNKAVNIVSGFGSSINWLLGYWKDLVSTEAVTQYRMRWSWVVKRYLEVCGRGFIRVLPQHLPGNTKTLVRVASVRTEIRNEYVLRLPPSPEYKSGALPLHQPAVWERKDQLQSVPGFASSPTSSEVWVILCLLGDTSPTLYICNKA